MSKRTRIIIAVVALVVVVAVVAFIALRGNGSGPEVETATVNKTELAVTVTASGKVEAGVSADVYAPTQGLLSEVFVSDGTTVTAGTELAVMDTAPLELQVSQARAGLRQAQAGLETIGTQDVNPEDVAAAQAGVAAAQEAYDAARVAAGSVGDQSPSSEQIDAAEAATEAAKNAYDAADAAYEVYPSEDATKTQLGLARDQAYAAYLGAKATEDQLKSTSLSAAQAQADAGVEQAYAALKSAQAQLAKAQGASVSAQKAASRAAIAQAQDALAIAEQNLEDATMVAPIDGVVIFSKGAGAAAAAAAGGASTSDTLGEGSPVSPASPTFTVVDLDALRFTAEVDEADVQRVKVGLETEVTLDAFPGETFTSVVTRVNPVAQTTATGGTVFEVEIALDDTGADILIGMKGDAVIKVSSQEGALTIPVESLFSEGGTDYVYVVDSSKLVKTEITVGATTDTEVEVVQGLEEGQVVALSGSTQYTDGMSVRTAQ